MSDAIFFLHTSPCIEIAVVDTVQLKLAQTIRKYNNGVVFMGTTLLLC